MYLVCEGRLNLLTLCTCFTVIVGGLLLITGLCVVAHGVVCGA